MNLRNELIDEISKYNVKETKSQQIDKYWNNWLIFKTKEPNNSKIELKKCIPPYFNSDINKTNEFGARNNLFN